LARPFSVPIGGIGGRPWRSTYTIGEKSISEGGNMDKRLTIVQNLLAALHRDDSGQDLIEYALIAALIALGSIIGMDTVANEINSAFNIITKKLSNAVS